jgi:hypothetical protein
MSEETAAEAVAGQGLYTITLNSRRRYWRRSMSVAAVIGAEAAPWAGDGGGGRDVRWILKDSVEGLRRGSGVRARAVARRCARAVEAGVRDSRTGEEEAMEGEGEREGWGSCCWY